MLTLAIGLVLLAVAARLLGKFSILGWLLIVIMIGFVSDARPKAAVFLGPIALFPVDIITVLLFAASLTRFAQLSKNLRRLGPIIVILVGLLMWSMLRGVAIYGVDAFVELRPFFYAAAGMMWSMSIDFDRPEERKRMRLFAAAVGATLSVIVLSRLASRGLASSSDFYVDAYGTYRTLRPVVAAQAECLALCGLFWLGQWLTGWRIRWLAMTLGVVFSGVAALTQHRSVWTALAAGILGLILWSSGRQRVRLIVMSLALLLPLLITFQFSNALDNMVGVFQSSFSAISGRASTLNDRTVGWSQLVSNAMQQPGAPLWGLPMGTGYERIGPNGLLETYSPHNLYVQLFLRIGGLGLGAFLWLLVVTRPRFTRRTRSPEAAAMFASIVVFLFAYGLEWYVAVFLGYALVSNRLVHGVEGLSPRDVKIDGPKTVGVVFQGR
jgi:hypothetical protein